MIIEEKEASTMLCCGNFANCHGSECMGWRYHKELMTTNNGRTALIPPKYKETSKGYCGLSYRR